MPKLKSVYRCQQCGYGAPKPLGQCPECSAWNSMVEEAMLEKTASEMAREMPVRPLIDFKSELVTLEKVMLERPETRLESGLREFDRLLGGGIVAGQVIVLAGPPGIGKSTLALQAAFELSRKGGKVLYVSGEESLKQVSSRAKRLGVGGRSFYLLCETNLTEIIAAVQKTEPQLVVIDSIQTVYHPELGSSPGSVGQVRECAAELLRLAKSTDMSALLLGHVTKDGSLAGPKVLEHIVDTVLYFDSEQHDFLRILRAQKNRFGPTSEIGLFEMAEGGIKEVPDAASFFLAERASQTARPGRAVSVSLEGARPLLIEVQSLVVYTKYPLPRRMATGIDLNRLYVLLASMEKHLRLRLEDKDVFVSLMGGLRLKDTALDLAACMAVLSSAKEKTVGPEWIFMGEVGLLGEIGRVPHLESRLREAARAGFKKAVVSAAGLDGVAKSVGIEIFGVRDIGEAADLAIKEAV